MESKREWYWNNNKKYDKIEMAMNVNERRRRDKERAEIEDEKERERERETFKRNVRMINTRKIIEKYQKAYTIF